MKPSEDSTKNIDCHQKDSLIPKLSFGQTLFCVAFPLRGIARQALPGGLQSLPAKVSVIWRKFLAGPGMLIARSGRKDAFPHLQVHFLVAFDARTQHAEHDINERQVVVCTAAMLISAVCSSYWSHPSLLVPPTM